MQEYFYWNGYYLFNPSAKAVFFKTIYTNKTKIYANV